MAGRYGSISAPDRVDRPGVAPETQLGGSGGHRSIAEGSVFVSGGLGPMPITAGGRSPRRVVVGDGVSYGVSAKGQGGFPGHAVSGYVPGGGSPIMVSNVPQTAGHARYGRVATSPGFYMVSAAGGKGRFLSPASKSVMVGPGYSRPSYPTASPVGVGSQHRGMRRGQVTVSGMPRMPISVGQSVQKRALADPSTWPGPGIPPWEHIKDGDQFIGPPQYALSQEAPPAPPSGGNNTLLLVAGAGVLAALALGYTMSKKRRRA